MVGKAFVRTQTLGIAAASLLAGLALSSPPCAASDRPRADRERLIQQRIADLGDDEHEVREAASQKLGGMDDAVPALKRALLSKNPEVARRAKSAVAVNWARSSAAAVDMCARRAEQGRFDLVIEAFARRTRWTDEHKMWAILAAIYERLAASEKRHFGTHSISPFDGSPFTSLGRFLQGVMWSDSDSPDLLSLSDDTVFLPLRACKVRLKGILGGSILLCAEGLETRQGGSLKASLILSSGRVEAEDMGHSVLVCSDDCVLRGPLNGCLVICGGSLTCEGPLDDCRFLVGGTITLQGKTRPRQCVLGQQETLPLGFLRFFDLTDVGTAVEVVDGRVRIREVKDGSDLATAGLRAGDLVLSCDTTDIKAADDFKRAVRALVATGDYGEIRVRRGNKTETLNVRFVKPLAP